MKDEFKIPLDDGYYIMNLENSHEDGSHWTAFVKIKSNIYYNDSYGVIMPQINMIYLNLNKIIYIIIHYKTVFRYY